jgi:hypothetical protein
MRDYLFHGKKVDGNRWVEGSLWVIDGVPQIYQRFTEEDEVEGVRFSVPIGGFWHIVHPESVGQYTGMNEFVMTDRSFNKPLFEGDIVEVWSRRRPPTENICLYRDKPTSQYDIEVKARAVIRFKYGEWFLDYDNEYNNTLCKLRGNEQCERTVAASHRLYNFGFHNSNEDWHREHNARCKWDDIVKIGTVFDNADLLEG